MTTCAECLTMLSTARLSELGKNTLIAEHCTTCERCAVVAAEIRFAEQRLALSLAEARPMSPSYQVASEAIVGADKHRRRAAARVFRAAVGMFGLLLLGSYVKEEWWDKRGPELTTSTLALKCMTPEQAMTVVVPLLRSSGTRAYPQPGFPALTVRGPDREVMQATAALDAFQSRFCGVPTAVGGPANPSVGKPGKD
jgi:hypothetical protein